MQLISVEDAAIRLGISAQLYSSSVIHKCFYWFGDKYVSDIDFENGQFVVNVRLKEGVFGEGHIDRLMNKIKQNLLDFKTREIISHETQNIKEMLIAKAFANSDEFDEIPQGDISDPVGFSPENF